MLPFCSSSCSFIGYSAKEIATLVTGYPPILIKSIKNSLESRIRFLVEVRERPIDEAANYPDFFQHGLKKDVSCSLSEMLDCNQK